MSSSRACGVLVAASAALLMAARRSELTLVANVALALEYEAICLTAEHRTAAGLSQQQFGIFLDAVLAMIDPVETHFMWRPQLRDPADELVLEAAVTLRRPVRFCRDGREGQREFSTSR